jgi:hypothetical protein
LPALPREWSLRDCEILSPFDSALRRQRSASELRRVLELAEARDTCSLGSCQIAFTLADAEQTREVRLTFSDEIPSQTWWGPKVEWPDIGSPLHCEGAKQRSYYTTEGGRVKQNKSWQANGRQGRAAIAVTSGSLAFDDRMNEKFHSQALSLATPSTPACWIQMLGFLIGSSDHKARSPCASAEEQQVTARRHVTRADKYAHNLYWAGHG